MPLTASSTYDGQQHFWCLRFRAAAAAVEPYFVGAKMDGTIPWSFTVGHRVLHEFVTPPSRIPPLFG